MPVYLKWPRVRSSTRTPLSAEPIITFGLIVQRRNNLNIKLTLYLVLCVELMISAVHL